MAAHIYIHVPFCDGKCHYCGFYSIVAGQNMIALYGSLPGRELDLLMASHPGAVSAPTTLYIGGGTPSMLGIDGLRGLSQSIRERIPLDALEEWTVELNPTSVTPQLLSALREIGVNRLSIGAQSFDDATLVRIGRRHDAQAVVRAIHAARQAGFTNLGIDLIAGLPGVTPELWRMTLDRALELELQHLSVYALSVEPGTCLAAQTAEGMILPTDEDQLVDLAQAEVALSRAGFVRYEISNYAQPGFECQHNLAVWRGKDYVGLGPAAASRLKDRRWTNSEDLSEYIEALNGDRPPPCRSETMNAADDAEERVLFALRLAEGVDLTEAVRSYPALACRVATWESNLDGLSRHGITEKRAGRWRLTSRGREVCDAVLKELL